MRAADGRSLRALGQGVRTVHRLCAALSVALWVYLVPMPGFAFAGGTGGGTNTFSLAIRGGPA